MTLHLKPCQTFIRQSLLHFMNVMNLISVANVSMHESMPKDDILAFNVTQEYTYN